MPALRGIEACVIAQSQIGRLPEFPHPDELSCQLRGSEHALKDGPAAHQAGFEAAKASKLTAHVPKVNATVSVYVPSIPAAQFVINYAVQQIPSSCSHFYFKLFINGRHITSWGINPKNRSSGRVEKALYEPSERWDQEQGGIIFKQQGIEARYFYFVDRQQLSIADDGGLIELQAFRARGRKRRAAKLDRYRHQDNYGVTTPSGGLLDNPQGITFFDFHLLDPKDIPYATFRFHYRSWANLYQLNLIPAGDVSVADWSQAGMTSQEHRLHLTQDGSTVMEQEARIDSQTVSLDKHCDHPILDYGAAINSRSYTGSSKILPRRNSALILRTPPQLRPRSAMSQHMPEPSKTLRDALTPGFPSSRVRRQLPDRPFPELPNAGLNDIWVSRSRKSSIASAAPSVALSLLSYVKDESYLDETVVYGQAQEVHMERTHPGLPLKEHKAVLAAEDSVAVPNISVSDHDDSSLAPTDAGENDPALLSPGNYAASTDNMLERQLSLFEMVQESLPSLRDRTARSADVLERGQCTRDSQEAEIKGALGIDLSKFPHLQLTHTESPHRGSSQQISPHRIRSPGLGRLWNSLRRSKSHAPLHSLEGNSPSRNYTSVDLGGGVVKERHVHWT